MPYLAALTLPEFGGFLTILGGILVGFYGLLKYVLNQAEKTSAADREERQLFVKAIDNLTSMTGKNVEAHKRVADAVVKQADEAEKRNGHLAELQLQSQQIFKSVTSNAKTEIITAVQNVKEQNVEHQTVKSKE
jgi:argininosuccinate lyase